MKITFKIISILAVCLCFFVCSALAQNILLPDKSLADVTIEANDRINILRLEATKGNVQAQLELGSAYYNGKGVEQDYEKAVKWFRKSAEQGNAEAQKYLGNCYYYGNGVSKDYAEAVKWYRKSAEKGDAGAQYKLGACYYDGTGVAQDKAEAAKWLRKSAEKGNAEARKLLALCESNGNESKAVTNSRPATSYVEVSASSSSSAYANKRVGERFNFGRYPQGANGEVKPITWRVLKRESDALLVISDLCLDAKPYNNKYCEITWSECSLRRWLNGEFLQKAFNAQEQSLIKTSRLSNNAGPETEDRVFLLSKDEAMALFANDSDRMAKPTAYAIANGAYASEAFYGNAWWWLRSRGDYSDDAAGVGADGGIYDYHFVAVPSGAVRPAFRIAI